MANILVEQASLENIADAIREKNGTQNTYKPSEMSQAIKDIESDSWYDTFWDSFQQQGNRSDYNCGFYDYCTPNCWNTDILYPKYDLKGSSFSSCFRDIKGDLNLADRFREINVKLDTSEATVITSMFRGCSGFTVIPEIDVTGLDINATGANAGMYYTFSGCSKLHTIEKIIVKRGVSFNNTFQNCLELANIKFEGEIDCSMSFPSSSKITVETVQSIIDCLVKYEGAGTPPVLSFGPTVKKRITEKQIEEITIDKGWTLA